MRKDSYEAKHYAWLRELVDWLKDGPCTDCGQQYPPFVMAYHHRDPAAKEFTVGLGVGMRLAWYRIVNEVAKCDLICANCHRIRTHN